MTPSETTLKRNVRLLARVLSFLFIGFFLYMLIGEALTEPESTVPMRRNAIVQLSFFGTGILGLGIAWKWEKWGAYLSLLAFIALFIHNPRALVPFMLIYPATACLFLWSHHLRKPKNV